MGKIRVLAEAIGAIFCAYLFSAAHPGDMLWGLPPDGGATNWRIGREILRTTEKNDHCTKAGKEVLILSYV
jgi:hypothetical protein